VQQGCPAAITEVHFREFPQRLRVSVVQDGFGLPQQFAATCHPSCAKFTIFSSGERKVGIKAAQPQKKQPVAGKIVGWVKKQFRRKLGKPIANAIDEELIGYSKDVVATAI